MRKVLLLFLIILPGVLFSQKKSRLPEPINLWEYDEYAPSISADGKTLIFQSGRYGVLVSGVNKVPEINSEGVKNKILNQRTAEFFGMFQSTLHPSGQWSKPESLENINRFSQGMTPVVGGPSISYDGNYLYFFANFPDDKSAFGREDLYYSVREKYGWSKPINLGSTINTPGYEGFPSITADGKQLYFVREDLSKKALGEERCYRIMRSDKDQNNQWKRPVELPSPINIDCEKAPRIMADSKTLVFSSIKKKGKGDFDLYMSRLDDFGAWSDPRPLDFVNTKFPDQSVAISACGDEMYYISNGDIFTIGIPEELRPQKMMTIQGFVMDKASQLPVSTIISLREKGKNVILASIESSKADGRYTLLAPHGKNYEVIINDKDYKNAQTSIDLSNINRCEIIKTDFTLERLNTVSKRNDIFIESAPVANNNTPQVNKTTSEPSNTEVVSNRRNAPKVVEIVEEERALLTTDNKVVIDSLIEKNTKAPELLKEKNLHTITLLVRDGDNNNVIKNVKITPENLNLKFDSERNSYEIKVSDTDIYQLQISAPGYQSESYPIKETQASKRVVIQLFADLPSSLTITVTDITTGIPLASTIEINSTEGKNYTLENPSGKTSMEFSKSQSLNLNIQAKGYTSLQKQLNIEVAAEGRLYKLDVKLEKITYKLNISALDKNTRTPLTQVNYKLEKDGKLVANGSQSELPITELGNYHLLCTVPGYQEQSLNLNITNNITDVVFEMVEKSKPTKEFVLQVTDEYTKAILQAEFTTNADIISRNPFIIQLQEGTSSEVVINVAGYPPFKSKIDFTSNQQQEIKLKKEAYPFRFRVVSDATQRIIENARVNIHEEVQKIKAQFEYQSGIIEAQLNPDKNYIISVSAEGYQSSQVKFDTRQALYDNLRDRLLPLKAQEITNPTTTTTSEIRVIETQAFGVIRTGQSVQLNNIYFDQSSPILKSESFTELDNLLKVLSDHAEIKIEVKGYTDNQGDFNKNVKLSKDRCQAVIDYLISKGISTARLTATGRGPLDPIAPNNTEENRSKNRRVEFVIN